MSCFVVAPSWWRELASLPCSCCSPATELTRTGRIQYHGQDCAPYLSCTDGLGCTHLTDGMRLLTLSSRPLAPGTARVVYGQEMDGVDASRSLQSMGVPRELVARRANRVNHAS